MDSSLTPLNQNSRNTIRSYIAILFYEVNWLKIWKNKTSFSSFSVTPVGSSPTKKSDITKSMTYGKIAVTPLH